MPAVTTRPVQPADAAFLFTLYSESGDVPALLAAIDRQLLNIQFTAQQSAYAARFPHAAHEVLLIEGEPAGQVRWAELDDEIHIIDISLLQRCRRQGAATFVYRRILEHAQSCGKPVRASVERLNGVSLAFHQRLGFSVEGTTDTHVLLTTGTAGR
jgi:ribosomal protein S18 acetylase RimI-like enzyme